MCLKRQLTDCKSSHGVVIVGLKSRKNGTERQKGIARLRPLITFQLFFRYSFLSIFIRGKNKWNSR